MKLYWKIIAFASSLQGDKILHCLLCVIAAGFLTSTIHKFSSTISAILLTVIVINLLIIGKELLDHKAYGLFSWEDVAWGEAGLLIGILLSIY